MAVLKLISLRYEALPSTTTSATPESPREVMAADAVVDNAPVPELFTSEVTNRAAVASPRATGSSASQQAPASPLSAPHAVTDTSRGSVPPPNAFLTGDKPLDAAILMSSQTNPSEDPPPAADRGTMDLPQQSIPPPTSPGMATPNDGEPGAGSSNPQQPMPPPTSPDMTTPKDGQPDAGSSNPQQPMPPPTSPDMTISKDGQPESSNSQQRNNPLSLGGSTPTKSRRQPIKQDGYDATSEADKQPGAVDPATPQMKPSETLLISMDSAPVHPPKQLIDSHNTTDAWKAHTSGLSEPDIDSLLELIQDDDGFEEESKPERGKLTEAIVAVRDASRSKDWSNLLRGVIILTTRLEFPKGDVSET